MTPTYLHTGIAGNNALRCGVVVLCVAEILLCDGLNHFWAMIISVHMLRTYFTIIQNCDDVNIRLRFQYIKNPPHSHRTQAVSVFREEGDCESYSQRNRRDRT